MSDSPSPEFVAAQEVQGLDDDPELLDLPQSAVCRWAVPVRVLVADEIGVHAVGVQPLVSRDEKKLPGKQPGPLDDFHLFPVSQPVLELTFLGQIPEVPYDTLHELVPEPLLFGGIIGDSLLQVKAHESMVPKSLMLLLLVMGLMQLGIV